MTKNKNIIEVKETAIGYAQKSIVSDINFAIQKGEFVTILGRNGSGKSTLLRNLARLTKHLKGTIFVQNKDINSFTPKNLAETISVVLTERPNNTELTVLELVTLGRQVHTNWIDSLKHIDFQKINQSLNLLEIQDLKDKKLHQLSDGELQKTLICRALAQDTPIILLDEPTSHLDFYYKIKLFSLFKKLVSFGKTIIVTTHEVNLSLDLADKIIVLQGESCHFGTKETLFEENVFDNLFSEEIIKFDKSLKQFKVNL